MCKICTGTRGKGVVTGSPTQKTYEPLPTSLEGNLGKTDRSLDLRYIWVLKSWGLGQPPQAQKLGLHMWSFSNLGLPAVTLRLAPKTRSHRSAAKFWEAPRHKNPGSSPFLLPGSFENFECPLNVLCSGMRVWSHIKSKKHVPTHFNTDHVRSHITSHTGRLAAAAEAGPEWNKY